MKKINLLLCMLFVVACSQKPRQEVSRLPLKATYQEFELILADGTSRVLPAKISDLSQLFGVSFKRNDSIYVVFADGQSPIEIFSLREYQICLDSLQAQQEEPAKSLPHLKKWMDIKSHEIAMNDGTSGPLNGEYANAAVPLAVSLQMRDTILAFSATGMFPMQKLTHTEYEIAKSMLLRHEPIG